jgi:hypothetical protein
MTAPSLVYVLLAVLAVCTGYAVGRLHQWYRMDADREEAYREGYDDAARSTFTMAARMVGPRGAKAQASTAVQPEFPAPAAVPPMLPPPLSSPAAAGPAASAGSRAAAGGRAGSGSLAASGSRAASAFAATPFPAPERTAFPPVNGSAGGVPSTGSGGGAGVPGLMPPAGADSANGAQPTEGVGSSADPASSGARSKSGRSTGKLPRRGRHLVPQELVRAVTYRLNPDRVARAKVPGALPLPGGEEAAADPGDETGNEPTARPTVPKPRSS